MIRKIAVMGLAILALGALIGPAQAAPKSSILGWFSEWGSDHWADQDFQPYVQKSGQPHDSQWDDRTWSPEVWAAQRGSATEVVSGFYKADILRRRYMKHDRPVLEVGPQFYQLGFYDQQRVAQMVDAAYGAENPYDFFMLHDWASKKPIGVYNQDGLLLR